MRLSQRPVARSPNVPRKRATSCEKRAKRAIQKRAIQKRALCKNERFTKRGNAETRETRGTNPSKPRRPRAPRASGPRARPARSPRAPPDAPGDRRPAESREESHGRAARTRGALRRPSLDAPGLRRPLKRACRSGRLRAVRNAPRKRAISCEKRAKRAIQKRAIQKRAIHETR